MSQAGASDRSITVGRDAVNSVFTSGDGNTVIVYQTVAAVATPLAGGKNPYLGLLAFTEVDADRFFGREELVSTLWERFRDLLASPAVNEAPRLLAILGPSGSGKSSLARAGLVPELARRPVGARRQRVATMTPGALPLKTLATLLAKVATDDPAAALAKQAELLALLQSADGETPTGLRRIAESLCADAEPLVLLIDQFEEIYSLCEKETERKTFIANLLDAASDSAGCLSVIITLRTDFLGATQADSRLNHVIAGQSVIVPAMSAQELRRAIAEPAIRAGHPLDEDTIQRLIAETDGRDGALPLLQFVLVRVWEGMVQGVTAAKTVNALGGVGGALGAEAERIFLGLNAGDQVIVKRAFLAMVQFNENERPTRIRAYLSELVREGDGPSEAEGLARVRGVVGAYAQPDTRLVTMAATAQGEQTVEVSHEAIFNNWARLGDWLAEGKDDLRLHSRVADAAKHWDRPDIGPARPEGALWRPPDLDLLRALRGSSTISLSSTEQAFFQASDQALKAELTARHRRDLAVRIALGVFLVLFLGSAGLGYAAWTQSRNAQLQRSNAFAAATWLAIQAGDVGRGLLLALEGVPPGRADTPGFESASAAIRGVLTNLSEVRDFVHPDPVYDALFAADDRRVVTYDAKTVRIWDSGNGRRPIKTIEGVQDFAVSPDGHRLATVDDKAVHILDATTGNPLAMVTEAASSVSFSPDGHRLAIARGGQPAGVWSADTGAVLLLLAAKVDTLVFSPNGRDLLSVTGDGPVQLWDAATGRKQGGELLDIEGSEVPAIAPTGTIMAIRAAGGMRHPLTVLSLPDGKPIAKMPGDGSFENPVFSPDGSILAVNEVGIVHLLTIDTDRGAAKTLTASLKKPGTVKDTNGDISGYAFSPDGRWLVTASSGQTISLWDMDIAPSEDMFEATDFIQTAKTDFIPAARTFSGHTAQINRVRFSRNGRFIISASTDGTARLWRTTPGVTSQPTSDPLPAPSAAGSMIPDRLLSYTSEGGQKIWERGTGKLVASAVANPHAEAATLSAGGGKFFVTRIGEKLVRQLDTVTGAATGPSIPAKNYVSAIALTPDGSKLVVGSGFVQIWDVRTGKPIGAPLHGFSSPIATSFSPAGQVAVGSEEHADLAIWTPSTGALVKLKGHTGGVTALAFAHNRDEVVSLSADNTGRIWDAKTGTPGPILPLGNGTLDAQAEYSPDDRLILTKSAGTVSIWDARTGLREQQLPGKALSAGWSPDGKTILIITDKGPQIVNLLSGEALRTEACRNRPRDFTDDERRAYGLGQTENSCATISGWRRVLDWAF